MFLLAVAAFALGGQSNARVLDAFRGYSEPNPEGIEFPDSGAITTWIDPKQHLVLYVKFRQPGLVQTSLQAFVRKAGNQSVHLSASDSEGSIGSGSSRISSQGQQSIPLGPITVRKPGYVRLDLSSNHSLDGVSVQGLELQGDNVANALINETRYRSAASVHVRWPTPKGAQVEWFYNEIVPKTDPLATYYMACGWGRGYFGIQVNSPKERRVIFSVWDSGNEKVDRSKVAQDQKVSLVEKGPGVFSGDFGNEGTGGHSHLVYAWKTGERQRFLVGARPEGDKTVYSGYYYFNDRRKWGLISSWRAPQDGNYLGSLYSFIEDFWGGEGQRQRLADFGPAWVRIGKDWSQVMAGSFTHTARTPNYREDYFFKIEGDRVRTSTGGYTDQGPEVYGMAFKGVAPSDPPARDVMDFIANLEART
jgi:hypothetical protein